MLPFEELNLKSCQEIASKLDGESTSGDSILSDKSENEDEIRIKHLIESFKRSRKLENECFKAVCDATGTVTTISSGTTFSKFSFGPSFRYRLLDLKSKLQNKDLLKYIEVFLSNDYIKRKEALKELLQKNIVYEKDIDPETCYLIGLSFAKYDYSVYWLRYAVKLGFHAALSSLGDCCLASYSSLSQIVGPGNYLDPNVVDLNEFDQRKSNHRFAIILYRAAAELNDPVGIYHIARLKLNEFRGNDSGNSKAEGRKLKNSKSGGSHSEARKWVSSKVENIEIRDGISELSRAADGGYYLAQFELGTLYSYGFGIEIDREKAIHYLKLASQIDPIMSLYELALLYCKGDDSERKRGIEALQGLSEKGYLPATHKLAVCYWKGEFIAKDHKKALELFAQQMTKSPAYFLAEADAFACLDEFLGRKKPRIQVELRDTLLEISVYINQKAFQEEALSEIPRKMHSDIVTDKLKKADLIAHNLTQIIDHIIELELGRESFAMFANSDPSGFTVLSAKKRLEIITEELQNFDKSTRLLGIAIKKGSMRSKLECEKFGWSAVILGICYLHGVHFKENAKLGFKFLIHALSVGNPAAYTYLGWLFFHGIRKTNDENHPFKDANGVYYALDYHLKANITKALEYFTFASKKEYPGTELGLTICKAQLLPESNKSTQEHFRSLCWEDRKKALMYDVKILESRGDVAINEELRGEILDGLRLAMEGGIPAAYLKLADYWSQQILTIKAFSYYKKAAQHQEWRAVYKLGTFYEQGLGFDKDLKLAMDHYEKAALHGEANAILRLAQIYETGNVLVEPNRAKALELLEDYEKRNFGKFLNHTSQQAIAKIQTDLSIVEQEKKLALEIFLQKAILYCQEPGMAWEGIDILKYLVLSSFTPAQVFLGTFYMTAEVAVEKDFDLALKYLQIAQQSGYDLEEDIQFCKKQLDNEVAALNGKRITRIKDLSKEAQEFLQENTFAANDWINVKMTIKKISDPHYSSLTPLVTAMLERNDKVTLELLTCEDINVNLIAYPYTDLNEMTALYIAITSRELDDSMLEIIKQLIIRGAEVKKLINGQTILQSAILLSKTAIVKEQNLGNYLKVIELLLKSGASPNQPNFSGIFPLFAVGKSLYAKSILKLLKDYGLLIDIHLLNGSTPLHYHIQKRHLTPKLFEFYIKQVGVKVEVKDKIGKTAREYLWEPAPIEL